MAVLAVAALLLAAAWLVGTKRDVAATNSVTPRGWVAKVAAGSSLCVDRLWMPAGSSGVRLRLAGGGGPASRVALALETPEGERTSSVRVGGEGDVDFPVRPLRRDARVRLCLRPESDLRGVAGLRDRKVEGLGYDWRAFEGDGPSPVEVDGKRVAARVSVWFLEPHSRSLAAEIPDMARRAATFRAGFVTPWTYLVILVLLPLLWLAALRTLWRGSR